MRIKSNFDKRQLDEEHQSCFENVSLMELQKIGFDYGFTNEGGNTAMK